MALRDKAAWGSLCDTKAYNVVSTPKPESVHGAHVASQDIAGNYV